MIKLPCWNLIRRSKRRYREGISLLEMLISLTIFGIVVLPVMMVTTQALDLSKESNNKAILNFEAARMFDGIREEINFSYRFLPFWEIATNSGLNMPQDKAVYFAYQDPASQKVVRLGYQLKEVLKPDTTSYSPKRWSLLRMSIPQNVLFQNLEVDKPGWNSSWGAKINSKEFYITGQDGNDLRFMYCKATVCNTAVNPKDADGVRLQAGTGATPGGMELNYQSGKISFSPFYLKLATRQNNPDSYNSNKNVLPVSLSPKKWSALQDSWIGEIAGTPNRPIYNAGDLTSANRRDLDTRDFHYNYRTGELLAVANSTFLTLDWTSDDSNENMYIFKFKPGLPDYKPYSMEIGGLQSYKDSFPVAINDSSPGWPPTNNVGRRLRTQSITQDLDNNIYILVYTQCQTINGCPAAYNGIGAWIEKFSPDGNFISRFPIHTDSTQSDITIPFFITYNPAMPNEILVLWIEMPNVTLDNIGAGGYTGNGNPNAFIRSYPKNQNANSLAAVTVSGQSVSLTDPEVYPKAILNAGDLYSTNGSYFSWLNVVGIEYDSINNRFIFVWNRKYRATTPSINEHLRAFSMDIDLNTAPLAANDDGQPKTRIVDMGRIHSTEHLLDDVDEQLQFANGIAYNPLNGNIFISTLSSPRSYYEITPNSTNRLRGFSNSTVNH